MTLLTDYYWHSTCYVETAYFVFLYLELIECRAFIMMSRSLLHVTVTESGIIFRVPLECSKSERRQMFILEMVQCRFDSPRNIITSQNLVLNHPLVIYQCNISICQYVLHPQIYLYSKEVPGERICRNT